MIKPVEVRSGDAASDTSTVEARKLADPDNIRVTYVDGCIVHGAADGVCALTLLTTRIVPGENVSHPDTVVAVRLRFGLGFAIKLRDDLNGLIAYASNPQGDVKPN